MRGTWNYFLTGRQISLLRRRSLPVLKLSSGCDGLRAKDFPIPSWSSRMASLKLCTYGYPNLWESSFLFSVKVLCSHCYWINLFLYSDIQNVCVLVRFSTYTMLKKDQARPEVTSTWESVRNNLAPDEGRRRLSIKKPVGRIRGKGQTRFCMFLCLIKHHNMETYGGGGRRYRWLCAFLISSSRGGQWMT